MEILGLMIAVVIFALGVYLSRRYGELKKKPPGSPGDNLPPRDRDEFNRP